ncbi:MAG: hypothetical protein RLZZ373_2642 [Pseudomonadota bacterium]|jgi:hypothetical protein
MSDGTTVDGTTVEFVDGLNTHWRLVVQPAVHPTPDGLVWFHVSAGPGSLCAHITVDQAKAIGAALTLAAEQTEAAQC